MSLWLNRRSLMYASKFGVMFVLATYFAASASAQTVRGTVSIPLFIAQAQCSQIPSDITGTLTIDYVAHRQIVNGVVHQGETDTVHGTATDTLGTQYVVSIEEVQNVAFTSSTRNIITLTSIERFTLRAQGGAPILLLVGSFHITFKPDGSLAAFIDNIKPSADQGCFPV
jgi:hypothetical protein